MHLAWGWKMMERARRFEVSEQAQETVVIWIKAK